MLWAYEGVRSGNAHQSNLSSDERPRIDHGSEGALQAGLENAEALATVPPRQRLRASRASDLQEGVCSPHPMSTVVYALFPATAADAAEAALQHDQKVHGHYVVQLHTRAPLDGNILPDAATEYGRNLLIAMGAGAVFMAVAGGIAGALDLMLGMPVAMGVGLGFVVGLLMGLVGAMQAGTRIAKPPLRELEPRLREGFVLLLAEVEPREVERIVETLEHHAPETVETLGSW